MVSCCKAKAIWNQAYTIGYYLFVFTISNMTIFKLNYLVSNLVVIFSVLERRFSGNLFKLPVEVRQGVEATFITNLANTDIFFPEHFTGMTYAYFAHEI